ncbi:hypothetical protein B0T18DRAFT_125446 [Schizothecium vesticola]|uniref:Uncharacterized protein n=1 Tax=Schizothecium vesticola TaxID=314040 RepID=A0AA40F3E6_9PEZI|nr:hypothetical protein B0T18DRAFT_125446 [Schizothecium vesticola]
MAGHPRPFLHLMALVQRGGCDLVGGGGAALVQGSRPPAAGGTCSVIPKPQGLAHTIQGSIRIVEDIERCKARPAPGPRCRQSAS